MKNLAEALEPLSGKAIRFLARHPAKKDVIEYGMDFSELLFDIAGIADRKAVNGKFQSPCCSNHYAGGRYCSSSVAVNPGGSGLIFAYQPSVEISSKHFLDKSEAYCSAKIRILPDEPSLKIRFRKWNETHHGGVMPGKPFFWRLKEPGEVFEALAHDFVHGRQPEYAAAFLEGLAYLPAVLARHAEPEPNAARYIMGLANSLEGKLK